MMAPHQVPRDDELTLLLEELYQLHHADFRGYTRSSLERCVARALESLGCSTLATLRERVRDDDDARRALVDCLTTQVSDLFRDPPYFRALREHVLPELATYPSIRVWVAGCGTGEEAWSIAILLREAGLLERALIHATDIDDESLQRAASAAVPAERAASFAINYRDAGGLGDLDMHCSRSASGVTFHPELRARVHFVEHSLATDSAFAEVQLVSCRNVLIYFGQALRDRAVDLFHGALCPRGFLGLGARETLLVSAHASRFAPVSEPARLYRRS